MTDFMKYRNALDALEHLENGNTTDARRMAKKSSAAILVESGQELMYWSKEKSVAAALYLKKPSKKTYDSFCNAR